jgi:CubicO group peptidase (beta-lactamase class C family)
MTTTLAKAAGSVAAAAGPAPHLREDLLTPRFYTTEIAKAASTDLAGQRAAFEAMLAGGGELDGVRILSPKTLEFMTMNHLPGNKTLKDMGDKTFSESRMDGSGFGLGWAVTTDVVATTQPGSVGTYSWGGMASTFFWIDPVEDIIAIQMTQLMPSGAYPIRPQLQQLVYAAIDD